MKNYSNLIHKNIQFIRDFESLSKIHSVRGPATALLNGKSNKVGMDFFQFFFFVCKEIIQVETGFLLDYVWIKVIKKKINADAIH